MSARRRTQRGVVFLLALLAMTVLFVSGSSFMSLASHQMVSARKDLAALQALGMAEGGINYAVWVQQHAPAGDSHRLEAGEIPASLGSDLRALSPTGSPAPAWVILPSGSEAKGYVWISAYAAGSEEGVQIIAKGLYRGYARAVRAIYRGGAAATAEEGDTDREALVFKHTLFTNADLRLAGACDIGGDAVVNGDADLGASGRIRGNFNVAEHLTLSGNSQVDGSTRVKGNVAMSGSAKLLGGTQLLGGLTMTGNPTVSGGIQCNGHAGASTGGRELQGTVNGGLTTPGNVSCTWGFSAPQGITYGGTFNKPQWMGDPGPLHHQSVPSLPASTGDAVPMPAINLDYYHAPSYSYNYTPSGGTYTLQNGTYTLSQPSMALNGNFTVTGGTTINAPNMHWYVSGHVNIGGNTTWNGKDMILYVHGNVTIDGTFNFRSSGKVIIVADGTINIGGGYNFGDSKIVLLSKTAVRIGKNTPLYAQIYAHNSAGTASVTVDSTDIRGAVIGDAVNVNGSGNVFSYVPPAYPFLPPDGGTHDGAAAAWSPSSWELLY